MTIPLRRLLAFVTLVLVALIVMGIPARASDLSIDVSNPVIHVTTGFNGADITIFGTQAQSGSIAIVVEGPAKRMTVEQKNPVMGMWTNTRSWNFLNMPAYYEVASSVPVTQLTDAAGLQQNRIGIANLMADLLADAKVKPFAEALIRLQQQKGVYGREIERVTYINPTLFKSTFSLPALVAPGHYRARAFLFRDGKLLEETSVPFEVIPEGLSAELRRFATQHSLLYGLAGVVMALVAGFLAAVLLKRE